jgi:hypothetical protein
MTRHIGHRWVPPITPDHAMSTAHGGLSQQTLDVLCGDVPFEDSRPRRRYDKNRICWSPKASLAGGFLDRGFTSKPLKWTL